MSRPLENTLTWSVSRGRLFRSCQRAYYYNFYGAWGGWDPNAPEQPRRLYLLKQITSFPLWGGSIVHDVIRDALTQFQKTGQLPELTVLQSEARKRLNAGWFESLGEEWKTDPKHKTRLFEHHYAQEGEEISAEKRAALRDRIYEALEGFCNSGIPETLAKVDPMRWGDIDKLSSFVIGTLPAMDNAPELPLKVWCALDFSYLDNDDYLHIVDWKTGTEHRDELRLQLACYALYALETWRIPLERIRLEGVFLNDSGRISTYEMSNETLVAAKDQILNSAKTMRAKLQDPVRNLAQEESFACTENSLICESCSYREVCPRMQQQQEF